MANILQQQKLSESRISHPQTKKTVLLQGTIQVFIALLIYFKLKKPYETKHALRFHKPYSLRSIKQLNWFIDWQSFDFLLCSNISYLHLSCNANIKRTINFWLTYIIHDFPVICKLFEHFNNGFHFYWQRVFRLTT